MKRRILGVLGLTAMAFSSVRGESLAVLRQATLWLDAADAATVVRDAVGGVSEWRSKGTRAFVARPSGARQPVYDTATWGVPTVDFGEIGSGRDLRYPRQTDIRTVFMVAWLDEDRHCVFLGDVADGKGNYHFHRGYGEHGSRAGAYADPEWSSLARAWNSHAPVTDLYRQGVPDDSFQVLCLEMSRSATSDSLTNDRDMAGRNGGRRLSELIVFDRVLPDAERCAVTDYLVAKWLAPRREPASVPDAGSAAEDARIDWELLERDIAGWKKFPAHIVAEVENKSAAILPGDRDPYDVMLRRTRALLADLVAMGADLSAEARALDRAARTAAPFAPRYAELRYHSFITLHALNRRIALKNPLLKDLDRLVFVGHEVTPYPHLAGSHMCDQDYGFHGNLRGTTRGDGLYALEHPFSDRPVAHDLLAGRLVEEGPWKGRTLGKGGYISPDVSWDGKTIAFAYTRAVPDLYRWHDDTVYHVFTCAADGAHLRQLTTGNWNEFDPCWLPNGRLAFVSERRGGFVRCSGDRPVPCFTLYSMFPDGSDIVQLSAHETNEWHPSVDNDGMVIYTRWDYVDRGSSQAHHLWRTTPDGCDPRAVNGNERPRSMFRRTPLLEASARAIPGSRRYVAVAGPHHGPSFGSLILIDPSVRDDGGMSQVRRVTPEQPFPESEFPPDSHWAYTYTGSYATPWPLSEKYFICAYDGRANGWYVSPRTRRYSLALVDAFGNKVRLYTHPSISCLDPMPLQARPKPMTLAPRTATGRPADAAGRRPAPSANVPKTATMGVANVYDSRYKMPTNTVIAALRVWQVLPKMRPLMRRPSVGADGHQMGRQLLGTVPVEKDGSAYFTVPADVPLYFQALDADGRTVQNMRSDTYAHPGERLMCIGCHEEREDAAKATPTPKGMPLAMRREPSAIRPGPDGSKPFNYPRLVQPVLDAKCVRCHGAKRTAKAPDLRAGDWRKNDLGHTTSYRSLLPYVHWFTNYQPHRKGLSYGSAYQVPSVSVPCRTGAYGSKLYPLLKNGHHGVTLTSEEWERLLIFMGSNGQFIAHDIDPAAQRDGKVVPPVCE